MIVIKLGGASGIDAGPLLDELATLDEPWVLVHGGNQELDALTRALGEEPEFFESKSGHVSRRTTPETMERMQMVYRGRINNDLVLRLQNRGVNAIGLSGIDGGLLRAERKTAIRARHGDRTIMIRDDLSGRVTTANGPLLQLLLEAGYNPIVTVPALAETGEAVNVDGDRAAAAIAAALGARTIINLSNVPGLLRDPADHETVIHNIDRDGLEEASQYAAGRYKNKIIAAREAFDGGVERVILATANHATPIAAALDGQGTVIQ